MARPNTAALDAEQQVGAEPNGLAGACRVGGVEVVADDRPRRRRAPIVERRLADQLDLDATLDALHRADEQ